MTGWYEGACTLLEVVIEVVASAAAPAGLNAGGALLRGMVGSSEPPV